MTKITLAPWKVNENLIEFGPIMLFMEEKVDRFGLAAVADTDRQSQLSSPSSTFNGNEDSSSAGII